MDGYGNIYVIDVNNARIEQFSENNVAAVTTGEDTPMIFSGGMISVSDVDAGSSSVQVFLSVTQGKLTLASGSGVTFGWSTDGNGSPAGDGTEDPAMTFRGTLTQVNNALNGLTYTPNANFNGADTLTITSNDLGNTSGSALSDTDAVTITVASVNDAPTIAGTAAAQAVNDNATLSPFSAVTIRPRFPGQTLTVSVTLDNNTKVCLRRRH